MRAIGPGLVRAELFLILIAALCLVGATLALIVRYADPPATTAETSAQNEPVSRPLPAGPRTFQP